MDYLRCSPFDIQYLSYISQEPWQGAQGLRLKLQGAQQLLTQLAAKAAPRNREELRKVSLELVESCFHQMGLLSVGVLIVREPYYLGLGPLIRGNSHMAGLGVIEGRLRAGMPDSTKGLMR